MMPRRNKKPLWIRILFLLIALLFLGAGAGLFYWNNINSPRDPNGDFKAFVITPGESATEVAQRLESEGLIRSSMAFKVALKTQNAEGAIQPGDFKLSPAMTLSEIIQTMSSGPIDKWVTFQEGWRVEEYAERLNKQFGVDKAAFLKVAKEGYMFPDTYLINQDATASDIASILKNTFEKRYTPELRQKIRAQGLTEEEGVILASLVEREARSDKVRTEVASIMLKRLNIGMKLDIDATVHYAKDTAALKNGTLDKFWQPITRADYTEVISPYNTYLNPGLPPAPICNPSVSSLNAVANATDTPYLYYFHNSKGETFYGTTLEEHNYNVATYR